MARRSKFNAKKRQCDGITFDSLSELARYIELKALQKSGRISNLEAHVKFVLIPAFMTNFGDKEREASYTCDFAYVEDGVRIVEDVKSCATAKMRDYVLRRKMFRKFYPEIYFRETIL